MGVKAVAIQDQDARLRLSVLAVPLMVLLVVLSACQAEPPAEVGAGASPEVATTPERAPNSITRAEVDAGWRLLFDGESLNGWRGYRREDVPASWSVRDGTIAYEASADGGDILFAEEYGDFELVLDWKISPGGNSGIFFRVTEDYDWPWETGAELQILDNDGHADGQLPETSAGSNFALHAPVRDVTRPVGEWNQARLIVRGPHVEHWLNDTRLLEYELWGEQWFAVVAASKFASMPGYGTNESGFIVLQDHGHPVWFRSLRIRPL